MIVIIAGGRDFEMLEKHMLMLDDICDSVEASEIVSGTARGADKAGEYYAHTRKIPCTRFPANWKKYGKSAGYIRNEEMAKYADMLVAFWDGKSRGTKHMIKTMKQFNKPVRVISYESDC